MILLFKSNKILIHDKIQNLEFYTVQNYRLKL